MSTLSTLGLLAISLCASQLRISSTQLVVGATSKSEAETLRTKPLNSTGCRGEPWLAHHSRMIENMRNPIVSPRSRRSMRLPGYDYRQSGVYFVTICTHQKAKLFGAVVDGDLVHSTVGEIVCEEWRHVAQARSNIQLGQYVVMPNHLHGLLFLEEMLESGDAQNRHADLAPRKNGLSSGSLGAIISQFKAAVSRRAWSGLIGRSIRIWQRNYYDHIVRSEKSLNEIRRYISENPARWAEDSLYVD